VYRLANIECGELSSARVVPWLRGCILRRRLALIWLIVWLWGVRRGRCSLFAVATSFIRGTASCAAPETAASAFSAAAHASSDTGDDPEYNEGANDYRDDNRPPVRMLAKLEKTASTGETYLQYACDMHPSHEEREALTLSAVVVTGFCRMSRTPMVAIMSKRKVDGPGSILRLEK
jgi:hypothetical protein